MKKLIVILSVLMLLALAAVPAFAHPAPPCNDSGEPGNSDYAAHHIAFLAKNGDLGAVEHDGDNTAHEPGVHNGFSECLEQAQSPTNRDE